MTCIRQFFAPPYFPNDEEKTRVAGVIHNVLLISLLSAAISIPLLFFVVTSRMLLVTVIPAYVATCLVLLRLLHRGYVLQAFSIGFVLASIVMFIEGLPSPTLGVATAVALLLVAWAGFAYGVRGMLVAAGLQVVIIWLSVWIKLGQAPADPANTQANLLVYQGVAYSIFLACEILVIRVVVRYMADMQARTHRTEQDLLQRNQQLETEISERRHLENELQQANAVLEQRVVERTQQWHQLNQSLRQEVAERKQAEEIIRHRVAFEQRVASISTKFMSLRPEQLNDGIQFAMQSIGEFTGVDLCGFMQVTKGAEPNAQAMIELIHEWISPASPNLQTLSQLFVPMPANIDDDWWNKQFATVGHAQVNTLDPESSAPQSARDSLNRFGIKSLVMVPVWSNQEIIAAVSLKSVGRERTWTDDNIILLRLAAEIIGSGIERKRNAMALQAQQNLLEQRVAERTHELTRLLQVTQTQEIQAAAMAERSRLSRELHDSVSQALFGIVLGTRTAMDRAQNFVSLDSQNHANGISAIIDPLAYILTLSEAALVELRALIFELRPESLQTEGLLAALRKQSEVLMLRQRIQTTAEFDADEPDVPLPVKEALYRIGIEAVQNLIKHSHATTAHISLLTQDHKLVLEIRDNGDGFDLNQNFPGHLGLHSMRERAAQFDATLQIESQLCKGTTVRVVVPC